MNVFFTDGARFISRHLNERLLKNGHLLACLDIF